jgi:hypothetical protein
LGGKFCTFEINEKCVKHLIGEPEGKRPCRRTRRRWEDSIRMDLRGIGWDFVDLLHLAHDRDLRQVLVKTVMKFLVPITAGNFLTT